MRVLSSSKVSTESQGRGDSGRIVGLPDKLD